MENLFLPRSDLKRHIANSQKVYRVLQVVLPGFCDRRKTAIIEQ